MTNQHTHKPELLLPVGNNEAFYAALEAGADAIYLGLKNFNARGRANNFTPWQVAVMIKQAHSQNVKVYITLNTVIKNAEIPQLIDTLFVLEQLKPDAIIIQDWGVYYIARKFFPKLELHASTQMGIHNSVGVNHAGQKGVTRAVVAREITPTELKSIAQKAKIELELFIHGALCYSFSGMCLFSSFMGGSGANRGICMQPCRRIYTQNKAEQYFFSLKDNELIKHIPYLKSLKIDSLKVEGRLKPSEYVYQVASAYRKAIDYEEKINEAQQELEYDLAREKTDYFMGKNVSEAITQSANTGLYIGKVEGIESGKVYFSSRIKPENNCRLRFRDKQTDRQTVLKAFDINDESNGLWSFSTNNNEIVTGDEVYLAGVKMKFPSKIKTDDIKINDRAPKGLQRKVFDSLKHPKPKNTRPQVFIRIDSLQWLKKIRLEDFDGIIMNFNMDDLKTFNPALPFIKKNIRKVWVELPKFIPEGKLDFYRNETTRLLESGIKTFSISHLSQSEILPRDARFMSNENVYLFNDAAIKTVNEEKVINYIYPLENDIDNMAKGSDRNGIVPVYFCPELFYSRMPVKLEKDIPFSDKTGASFRKEVKDGVTITLPENPVSLTQYKSKLERFGFYKFLIDMSHTPPSKNTPQTIKKRLLKSEQIQPSSNFNFKMGLT